MAERAGLPPPVRTHLEQLTGRHGIYQHARGPDPDPAHGTCTDDVARALGVDLLHAAQLGWAAIRPSATLSLAYLEAAYDPTAGRFRNFRADDGTWLEGPASQDAQGRAMLAIGTAVGAPGPLSARAAALFDRALDGASRLTAARGIASTILGCVAVTASPPVAGGVGLERLGGGGPRDPRPTPRARVRIGGRGATPNRAASLAVA